MHLSKRLRMVADCVTKGNVVADVGCDHAYISIYLVEGEVAPKTIALDVNEGPLLRAQENIKSYGMEEKITTRLSDGLEKLEPNEVDSIVIAGMGGALMVRILEEGKDCVATAKELILQPQSESWKVREYLHNLNFEITKEDMCIDEGKYYTVLHAHPHVLWGCVALQECSNHRKEGTNQTKVLYNKYGKFLLENRHPVLKEFLEKEKKKSDLILKNLKQQESSKSQERTQELLGEIALLDAALSYYNED